MSDGLVTGGLCLLSFAMGILAVLWWQFNQRQKMIQEELAPFRLAVKNGDMGRLFIFDAQVQVPGFTKLRRQLVGLFANEHNLKLIESWLQNKLIVHLSLDESDAVNNPVHRAGVLIAIGLEKKLAERDGRKSSTRNRLPIEPDNVLGSLQSALGSQAGNLAEGLVSRYTIIVASAAAAKKASAPPPRP